MQNPSNAPTGDRVVYTVSELNRQVKDLLEHSFPLLWIEGELSNLARPRSGHWYFTLKDAGAQVRCAMFRTRNGLLRFQPTDGMQVLVRARLGLYEARGDYQLIVEHMEEAGDGALRRAFEALRDRLMTEGLFDDARKRPIPPVPARIGVITSPTGAAVRDILSVLRRRFPLARVMVYPVPVQGAAAAPAIVDAFGMAAARAECDVLILARGGGSLEDLWAFNEEAVARAIAACPIPVVTGIGHEVDFTIADFVADRRAPTPSAAAELLSPDHAEWRTRLARLDETLMRAFRNRLATAVQHQNWLAGRLDRQHPGRALETRMQRLDDLDLRLRRGVRARLVRGHDRVATAVARLRGVSPRQRLERLEQQRDSLYRRLDGARAQRMERERSRLKLAMRALHAVSPLATLERGYAIATVECDGTRRVVTDAANVKDGDDLDLRLHRGRLACTVTRRTI